MASALEPRVRVAFVSGYLNTFYDSVGSLAHCVDNYVPGILNWVEMSDIAGLIAPRPLFVESGEKDRIFPVEASVSSVRSPDKWKKIPPIGWAILLPIGLLLVVLFATAVVLLAYVSVALSGLFTWLPAILIHAILR